MSELWQERDPLVGYRIFRIGLDPPREVLYTRINERASAMFDQGLIEETQSLLGRYGTQSTVAPLSSLGYKQSVQFLRRELTLQEAVAAAQQGHRNYAKRQMTWFRREPNVTWLRGFGDDQTLARSAEETILAETQRK
jgi:tRNA dimethylallyltransferase